MILTGACAIGFWLVVPDLRKAHQGTWRDTLFLTTAMVLGSLSAVGPPRIIAERLKHRLPVRPGRLVWLVTGLSSWMLLPPVIFRRFMVDDDHSGMAMICFVYTTPLIGLLLMLAFLTCGLWRFRRVSSLPWRERFGRGLALVWSLLGVYVLYAIYRTEIVGGPLFNL